MWFIVTLTLKYIPVERKQSMAGNNSCSLIFVSAWFVYSKKTALYTFFYSELICMFSIWHSILIVTLFVFYLSFWNCSLIVHKILYRVLICFPSLISSALLIYVSRYVKSTGYTKKPSPWQWILWTDTSV